MQIKKMVSKKEVEYVITETYGEEAIPLGDYLINKTNVSEFVIANDLNVEIHKIRHTLYKLFEEHVVIFNRKKDKIKGWYICYWSLNEAELSYLVKKIKQKKIVKLKERIAKEQNNNFYMCKNACTRINFDSAFELNFKCPDCGEIMHQQDNERTIEFLTNKIIELEKEVEEQDKILKKQNIEKSENNKNILKNDIIESKKLKQTNAKKSTTKSKKTVKETKTDLKSTEKAEKKQEKIKKQINSKKEKKKHNQRLDLEQKSPKKKSFIKKILHK